MNSKINLLFYIAVTTSEIWSINYTLNNDNKMQEFKLFIQNY